MLSRRLENESAKVTCSDALRTISLFPGTDSHAVVIDRSLDRSMFLKKHSFDARYIARHHWNFSFFKKRPERREQITGVRDQL